jgi:hypothetical protein
MYVSIGALYMIHIGVVYSMVRYSPIYMHKSAGHTSPLKRGTPKGNRYTLFVHIGALYIVHISVYSMVRYSHMDVQVSRRPYTMHVSICALYMMHIGVVYSLVRYSPMHMHKSARHPSPLKGGTPKGNPIYAIRAHRCATHSTYKSSTTSTTSTYY